MYVKLWCTILHRGISSTSTILKRDKVLDFICLNMCFLPLTLDM